MKKILNGIFLENPLFALALGLVPALALTNNFETAYIIGIIIIIVLVLSSFIISLLRKAIPSNVDIAVYLIIIGTVVTGIKIFLQSYLPKLVDSLGIYLPIIVIDSIILGRAINVFSKEKVGKSLLDALLIGIKFLIALVLISLLREVIGSNTITIMDKISPLTGYRMIYEIFPKNNMIPISIIKDPAGAFIIVGILIGIFESIRLRKGVVKNESN